VCVLLVILVLLQSGKEGMGVIFGGGNTSVFGSSGAGSLLAKMTAFVAVIFVITSLAYTYVTSEHVTSESAVLNVRIEEPAPAAAPAAPAQPEALIPTAPVRTENAAQPAASAPAPAAPEAAAPAAPAEPKAE
ncbi:MAG: preprotein translocase subunit SecG, partial [Desulfovibrionaceae bacterium]|nr:preprotein translocase subunit SecG [Desulfovibrionaceae bacterium]